MKPRINRVWLFDNGTYEKELRVDFDNDQRFAVAVNHPYSAVEMAEAFRKMGDKISSDPKLQENQENKTRRVG